MNWGFRIVLAFLAFMATIISMVVICMRQDVSLVAPDYYKQEIAYQSHIDKQKNAILAADHMEFSYDKSSEQFSLISKQYAEGELHLYRPSDAAKDVKVPFIVNSGEQAIITSKGLEKGLWRAKLTWQKGEKTYYLEKTVVI